MGSTLKTSPGSLLDGILRVQNCADFVGANEAGIDVLSGDVRWVSSEMFNLETEALVASHGGVECAEVHARRKDTLLHLCWHLISESPKPSSNQVLLHVCILSLKAAFSKDCSVSSKGSVLGCYRTLLWRAITQRFFLQTERLLRTSQAASCKVCTFSISRPALMFVRDWQPLGTLFVLIPTYFYHFLSIVVSCE